MSLSGGPHLNDKNAAGTRGRSSRQGQKGKKRWAANQTVTLSTVLRLWNGLVCFSKVKDNRENHFAYTTSEASQGERIRGPHVKCWDKIVKCFEVFEITLPFSVAHLLANQFLGLQFRPGITVYVLRHYCTYFFFHRFNGSWHPKRRIIVAFILYSFPESIDLVTYFV